MFFAGMAYCYFVVFGVIFRFISGFAPGNVNVSPDIEQYFDFVMRMFLAFGLAFEVPIVVMLLVRFDITSVAKLRRLRPYMIVGAFVIAAVVTPPDVLSQLLLAVPLWLLFELGVLLATLVGGRKAQDGGAEAPAK
jgi:sec-independent protein translocase protein TatC